MVTVTWGITSLPLNETVTAIDQVAQAVLIMNSSTQNEVIHRGQEVEAPLEALRSDMQWLPTMARDTPWNEDDFVRLYTEMIRLTALVGGTKTDEIDWVSSESHKQVLDEARSESFGLSTAAISLLRRLPYSPD